MAIVRRRRVPPGAACNGHRHRAAGPEAGSPPRPATEWASCQPVADDRHPTLSGVERLYTPWRRAFIESAASGQASTTGAADCFLCEGPAQPPEQDRQRLVLFRGSRVFVVMNLYPYNNGHLLVAPYRHTGDFAKLDADVARELAETSQRCVAALTTTYSPEAFNLGMNLGRAAGAGVRDHLHVHVVPRWNGDTSFMPVIGGTKVLPESLEQTYDRLHPLFQQPVSASREVLTGR